MLKLFPALMLALLAGLSGIWFALKSSDIDSDNIDVVQQKLTNAVIFPSDYRTIPEFNLIGQNGQSATSKLFQGQWNLLFFGFTRCPDVCPLTLNIIKDVVERIKTDNTAPIPKIVFVSVDPKRDTPEKLNSYVGYFDPEFVGLTGELNAILELTRELNMVVQFTANDENPENYSVDHSASILLIDPDLKVRGSFKYPHESKQIFDDYKTLVQSLPFNE